MPHRLQPTAEQAAVIEEMMKAPYPVTIGSLATRLGARECDAAALLSEEVAAFVAGDASARFAEVWEALADWDKVTLFIIHAGNVFDIEGKLFKGKIGPGQYGVETGTIQNREGGKADPELNMLVVRGAVPGPKGSLVTVKPTVKVHKIKQAGADISKNPQKASGRYPQKASARNM